MANSLVRVHVLGALEVHVDGQAITRFRSVKAQALLAYLAIEADRPHARASLAALLWPDQPAEFALRNLTQTLVHLRSALGDGERTPPILLVTRQSLQWNSAGDAYVDIQAFLHAAKAGDAEQLSRASALYRGPLLAGFGVDGCADFDEWSMLAREHVERLALHALAKLSDASVATAAYDAAEAAARRQLAIDPWREGAHRQVMVALAASGRRGEALAHYEVCRRALAADLGVEPDSTTTELFDAIKNGTWHAPPRTAAAPDAHVSGAVVVAGANGPAVPAPGTPPRVVAAAGAATDALSSAHDWREAPDTGVLHGRAAEVAQLEQWLLHDRCRLVAVLGMGGVGKTTLAATVAKALAAQFDHVIWRSLLNAPPLDELLRPVLQSLAASTPVELPAGLDQQVALLLDGLRRQRCLLILDNLESLLQADGSGTIRPGYEGYADLLHRLAHSRHTSCLVLTSRERPQGLERWEADLPAVRVLRLEGLDTAAGEAILHARGLEGQATDARALVERYGGHPLALKLVAHTVHELFGGTIGAFLRQETPIFDDIRAVLDQQLARLSPLEQELLTWLAIEREPAAVATLRGNLVQPQPAGTLVEALRALQRRSLLQRVGEGVTLPNVVIEYLTERLVAGVCGELLHAGESRRRSGARERATLLDSLAMLNRFALVKAQAEDYVRHSQKRMILHPVVDRLLAELGDARLATRVQAIVARLRARAPRAPGYAGGNLLNLLLHAGIDVSGYDFSRLSMWQADLQGRVGVGLNFGAADLTGSTFTLVLHPSAVIAGPAGQLLVAGSDESDLCVWRASHGQLQLAMRTPGPIAQPLVVSPDGRRVAAGCRDFAIRVWSVATGALLHTLEGHTAVAQSAAWSQDGQLLATSSAGDTIHLWDVDSGRNLRTLRHPLLRRSRLAFRPSHNEERPMDAPLLASGGDERVVCVWDLEQGQLIAELRGHEEGIECLAFSPDGSLLASGSHDGLILLWEVQPSGHGRLRSTLRGHGHIVRAVVFDPNGRLLASGSADGTVRRWDVGTGQTRQVIPGGGSEVIQLAFDSDGGVLAGVSEDRAVRQWEVETGRPLQSLSGYMAAVLAVRFRPDGRRLASASGDGRIHLWNSRDGRLGGAVHGHAEQVNALAWSPDGRLLASSSTDATIRLWDLAAHTAIRTLRGPQGAVKSLAFSPDGRRLAGAGSDRTIHVWTVRDGAVADAEQPARMLRGHAQDVETVAFSPDGCVLLSSSLDGTARLWSVGSGQVIHVLTGHTVALAAAAFSPRGERIATLSYDDTIRLWEVATGRCIDGWENIAAAGRVVAFSPSGELLAHSNHTALELRDVRTATVIRTLRGHTDTIYGLDWSPSEPVVASSAWDGTIRLWNVDTGACLQTLVPPGPYAGMNIAGATGISDAQRVSLEALGAVDTSSRRGSLARHHSSEPCSTVGEADLATTTGAAAHDAGLVSLTGREQEVLRLVAQGLRTRAVAAALDLSPLTVNVHLRAIYRKLGVRSRTAATRLAIEQHLV